MEEHTVMDSGTYLDGVQPTVSCEKDEQDDCTREPFRERVSLLYLYGRRCLSLRRHRVQGVVVVEVRLRVTWQAMSPLKYSTTIVRRGKCST